jgi:hypothetical protein
LDNWFFEQDGAIVHRAKSTHNIMGSTVHKANCSHKVVGARVFLVVLCSWKSKAYNSNLHTHAHTHTHTHTSARSRNHSHTRRTSVKHQARNVGSFGGKKSRVSTSMFTRRRGVAREGRVVRQPQTAEPKGRQN